MNSFPMARIALALALSTSLACSSSEEDPVDSGRSLDAGEATDSGPLLDAGDAIDSGSLSDAGADGGAVIEDAGPTGEACAFNVDCRDDERCECDEVSGCYCAFGTRGTGRVGVDACVDGNDCASSLCLEGPNDDFVCSSSCDDDNDCAGVLPVCADIAFVGRICIRE